MRQWWGLGVANPQILGWGSWELQRNRWWVVDAGWVWENTISYFGMKVCWKVIIFQKKEEKFGMNVGVNGSFCEKLKNFEEKSLELLPGKLEFFLGKSETSF